MTLVEVGEYWLDSARPSIEMDEFNVAIAEARSAANSESAAEWYERSANLYQGEYLQNLYYEWVFAERRRLAQACLNAFEELSAYHLSNRAPQKAIGYLEKPSHSTRSTKPCTACPCGRTPTLAIVPVLRESMPSCNCGLKQS